MRRLLFLLPVLLTACATASPPASQEASALAPTAGATASVESCDVLLHNATKYLLEVGVYSGATRIRLGAVDPAQSIPYALPCSQGHVQVSARTVVPTDIKRGNSHFLVSGRLVEGQTVRIALRP